jgi:glutamyl-tRNA synthetase
MIHTANPPDQSNRRPLVGRLAPSPTGGLHLGHARTFLLAWLAVRRGGGRLVLRVEDIDTTRVRPGMAEAAVADLRWLGLDWDEGPDVGGPHAPYEQSRRLDRYAEALGRLKARELVYPCTCTRAEIARAASAPHAEDEGPTYPGTCSGRTAGEADALGSRPFAWRFRVAPGEVCWGDRVLGGCSLDPSRIGGDFTIARSDAGPSYQLAVVVDDGAMGVNQVVRGEDLTTSTPRQILLHRALGSEPPEYAHVPLAVGPDGRRLAKRDGSIKLSTLREAGVDPRRLVSWIARSCGWTDSREPTRPGDWLGRGVDPLAISREPWMVTSHEISSLRET